MRYLFWIIAAIALDWVLAWWLPGWVWVAPLAYLVIAWRADISRNLLWLVVSAMLVDLAGGLPLGIVTAAAVALLLILSYVKTIIRLPRSAR